MLRIVARVLELEDEPSYEGYFPRVGGARDERCEVVVTVFGPEELQEAQARLASTRTGPRIRRTVRKATGRPPRLQHQPPQPASTPAEPRSPVVDAEDVVRDIEMIP
ncbi:hypothetical protein GUJ93_ZPchr0013g35099 [Zizania palustris]|uniref:Uncharacterized protein n=1 Tax=Zizania palustris TaxID=103762 RepID=A0A8J5WT90_ZIZPA|nr:hypothetical protein GUJ93_ZPchr0013g35099 [Zizania palustris]